MIWIESPLWLSVKLEGHTSRSGTDFDNRICGIGVAAYPEASIDHDQLAKPRPFRKHQRPLILRETNYSGRRLGRLLTSRLVVSCLVAGRLRPRSVLFPREVGAKQRAALRSS